MSAEFFFPAEWTRQDAVMLAWPHTDSDWQTLLPGVEDDFLQLAAAVLRHQPLLIICRNSDHRRHIETLLRHVTGIHAPLFFETPYNDTWCRDFGPVSVIRDGRPVLLDFQFNGWGNRYDASLDNLITQKLQQEKIFCAPTCTIDFILEGGSVESNGIDTVLTTENCLLNKNRNNLHKQKIETLLKKHLHAGQMLWLKHGHLQGDDTDCHIDNLARFVSRDTIVYLSCDNTRDAHYTDLREMQFELGRFRQPDGEPYRLLPLPLPAPCYSELDGRRLPASYLNFLIINDAVLVPEFACDTDQIAQQTLQQCFPDRTIIAVNSRRFIEQNGGIHCLTMQLPVHTLNKDR